MQFKAEYGMLLLLLSGWTLTYIRSEECNGICNDGAVAAVTWQRVKEARKMQHLLAVLFVIQGSSGKQISAPGSEQTI